MAEFSNGGLAGGGKHDHAASAHTLSLSLSLSLSHTHTHTHKHTLSLTHTRAPRLTPELVPARLCFFSITLESGVYELRYERASEALHNPACDAVAVLDTPSHHYRGTLLIRNTP